MPDNKPSPRPWSAVEVTPDGLLGATMAVFRHQRPGDDYGAFSDAVQWRNDNGMDESTCAIVRHPTRRYEIRQTVAFLRALGIDEADAVTWQTFDDRGRDRSLAQTWHAPFAESIDRLVRMQDRGAGAFLCVAETDGNGRKVANVVRVRALFVDIEDMEPREWHLEPSLVVRTGKGRHAYWTMRGNMPLDDYRQAQRRLAAHYNADPAVHDLPRVMRLPGGLHQKGCAIPVLIESITANRYTHIQAMVGIADLPEPVALPRPSAEDVARVAARMGGSGKRRSIIVSTLDVIGMFRDMGMLRDGGNGEGQAVVCPWADEHSSDSSPTATMVWNASAGMPGFKCLHAHCDGRGLRDVMSRYHRHLDAYAKTEQRPSPAVATVAAYMTEVDR